MIALFTDFGVDGPYVGQMHLVLKRAAPTLPVVDLMHDAPAFDVTAAAHLLGALSAQILPGDVVVAVVDPGVGTESRHPVALEADGCWFVGPGNGLLAVVARRAAASQAYRVEWRPSALSSTFHGRDLFAPVAASIAVGQPLAMRPGGIGELGTAGDPGQVIYIDRYGNAATGIDADSFSVDASLEVRGVPVGYARTFAEVPVGSPFWYRNSSALVELAVNQGSAAQHFGLAVGDPVRVASHA